MADGRYPPALVTVTRGPAVESRHRAHGVLCDAAGRVQWAFGDPELAIFPRSALKPLQALPAVARGAVERFGLTGPELAVMTASHAAEPFHLEAVRGILARIGATEADLFCGPHAPGSAAEAAALIRAGREPEPIHNNCSGKHAGMLTLARLLEAPLAGYQEADHPVQRAIQEVLAELCGVDRVALQWGVDGCGVPTYCMTLRALARGFAALAGEALPAGLAAGAGALTAAMTRHPEYVGGTGAFVSELMGAAEGALIAKGGAEGVFGVGIREGGLGLALKIEDGNARAIPSLVLGWLRQYGLIGDAALAKLEKWAQPPILNTRRSVVGHISAQVQPANAAGGLPEA